MPTNQEYVPFGPQWEKAVMKMSKSDIVRMYRQVCLTKINMEEHMDRLEKRLQNLTREKNALCKKD